MRLNKFLTPIGLLGITAMLGGCSSEEPVVIPDNGGEAGSGQFISLSLSGASSLTRASQPGWDLMINNLLAYVTEKGSTKVVSVGTPISYPADWNNETLESSDLEYQGNGRYEVLVKLVMPLTPGEDYDLYLVANASEDDRRKIMGSLNVKSLEIPYNVSDWECSRFEASGFMLMNSDAPISINIEDKEYPRENPYYAGGEKGSANRQSISLTRQLARIDFTSSATNPNNIFSVNTYEQDEEGNQGDAKPLFDIRFYEMKIENIADKEYLFSTPGSLTNTFISPSSQSFSSQTFTIGGTAGTKPLCYLPEHIPAYSSLTASNNSVTFGNTTYMEFAGLLTAGSACPASLKTAMEAGKDIWYYDDGTFQTIPRVLAEDEAEPVGDSWHKLTYTTVGTGATAISGYAVKYRKAIRHNALADNGTPATDANSATLNANDGRIRAMEYGVLRNHIYEVSIGAVRSLPRPVSDTDLVEDGKETLELQIKIPTTWTYHRLSTEVEVQ